MLNDRTIQQVGPPMEIYRKPANIFVAQFVGSPAMSMLPAELVESGDEFATLKLGDESLVATRVARVGLPTSDALRLDEHADLIGRLEKLEAILEAKEKTR